MAESSELEDEAFALFKADLEREAQAWEHAALAAFREEDEDEEEEDETEEDA